MTGIFKANNPANTFLLLLYGALLKLPAFMHPVIPLPQQTDGFLYKALLSQLAPIGRQLPAIYPCLSFLLLFLQAIIFNQFANGQKLLPKPNYLIAMSFLLITSLFPEWNVLSSPLIVSFLLVWVWARLSALGHVKNVSGSLFNIGITIGITTFFYFPSIAFSALIIVGLLIIRPFQLTEWIIALLGIATPYYFLFSYVFLTDQWQGYRFPGISVSLPHFVDSVQALAAIILVGFAAFVGLYFIRKNLLRQLVQTRKSWNLVFLLFIIALFIPFINASHDFGYWILCALPLSAFAAAAFYYPVLKWYPVLLHWLMVALVLAGSYIG